MIEKSEVLVIVRSAGERTELFCSNRLYSQCGFTNVTTIHEVPFSRAIQKGFELGIDSKKAWLLCIDADVLIDPDGINRLIELTHSIPDYVFEIQGLVRDKFIPVNRPAGNHLYRMKYAREALKCIPKEGTTLRPEGTMLKAMAAKGFPWYQSDTLVGIHDFEQYYGDIFRKCFLHAHKHSYVLDKVLEYWLSQSKTDNDFIVAIGAVIVGASYEGKILVDKNFYKERADQFLSKLNLTEKDTRIALDFNKEINLDSLEEMFFELQEIMAPKSILNREHRLENSEPEFSFRRILKRLAMRFSEKSALIAKQL